MTAIQFRLSSHGVDVKPALDALSSLGEITECRWDDDRDYEQAGRVGLGFSGCRLERTAVSGRLEVKPESPSGPRIIKAPDGREIEVHRSCPSPFGYAWLWRWKDGANTYMGPVVNDCLAPLDREPKDAEVLADYAHWAGAKAAASSSYSNDVTLVGPDGRERYATVPGISGLHVLVTWEDDVLHYFSRADGRCLESSNGIMRGWRIHPDELPRFQVKALAEAADKGFVIAPDGMAIRVERGGGPGAWIAEGRYEFVHVYSACPTDAEVLADYEAWKKARVANA